MSEQRKVNNAIFVIYQASGATSGLTDVAMDVYDEMQTKDVGKSVAAMTEIGSTGRYFASFTPDAEGDWTVIIDSATKKGKVVGTFNIVGHDIDSVGDAIAALNDISAAEVSTEVTAALATYDAPTKAEMDAALAALNDISAAEVLTQVATALVSYDPPTKAELDLAEEGIRGADGDTLKTISDQLDSFTAPPMIG